MLLVMPNLKIRGSGRKHIPSWNEVILTDRSLRLGVRQCAWGGWDKRRRWRRRRNRRWLKKAGRSRWHSEVVEWLSTRCLKLDLYQSCHGCQLLKLVPGWTIIWKYWTNSSKLTSSTLTLIWFALTFFLESSSLGIGDWKEWKWWMTSYNLASKTSEKIRMALKLCEKHVLWLTSSRSSTLIAFVVKEDPFPLRLFFFFFIDAFRSSFGLRTGSSGTTKIFFVLMFPWLL